MNPILIKEIANIIVRNYINDFKTFHNIALTSKQFSKVCKELASEKMDQFARDGKLPNGRDHGEYQSYYHDKSVRERCSYKNGIKHGEDVLYYENGEMAIYHLYLDGKIHGEYKEYSQDGKLRVSCTYANGKKHGKYQRWNENGILIEDLIYVLGKIEK